MCVWSAYIGERNAADVVWETGRRIEGFWSGYHTGLVTCADGAFHHAKTVGTCRDWEREYRLADLPGHVGIFHSRTGSGGGREWGHPFISYDGKVALAAQGASGIFENPAKPRNAAAQRVADAGWRFASADPHLSLKKYPRLADGSQVHFSEVLVQNAALEYAACGDPVEAIRRTMTTMPMEAVMILIFRDFPGTLYIGNVNQRAVFVREKDGIYLATTALAFTPSQQRCSEIPGNTIATVSLNEISFVPVDPLFQVDETLPPGILPACLNYMKTHGPVTLGELTDNVVKSFFPGEKLVYRPLATYRVIETLAAANWLEHEDTLIEGFEGKSAARTLFSLNTSATV